MRITIQKDINMKKSYINADEKALSAIYARINMILESRGITKYEMIKRLCELRGEPTDTMHVRSLYATMHTHWGKSRSMSIFIEYAKAIGCNLWEFFISKDKVNELIKKGELLSAQNDTTNSVITSPVKTVIKRVTYEVECPNCGESVSFSVEK